MNMHVPKSLSGPPIFSPPVEAEIARLQRENRVLRALRNEYDLALKIVEIIELCGAAYGCSFNDILGHYRKDEFVAARHDAAFLLRYRLKMPLAVIGRVLGQRDHTTIRSAVLKIARACGVDAGNAAACDAAAKTLLVDITARMPRGVVMELRGLSPRERARAHYLRRAAQPGYLVECARKQRNRYHSDPAYREACNARRRERRAAARSGKPNLSGVAP